MFSVDHKFRILPPVLQCKSVNLIRKQSQNRDMKSLIWYPGIIIAKKEEDNDSSFTGCNTAMDVEYSTLSSSQQVVTSM